MQRMHQPVSFAEVVPRILERRVENLQILIQKVTKLINSFTNGFEEEVDTNIQSANNDDFGFEKTLVMMTKANMAFGVSSRDGRVHWHRYIRDPVRIMVLDQAEGEAQIDIVTSKG